MPSGKYKRTSINKLGKIGLVNKEARRRIAEKAEELGLNRCELDLKNKFGIKDVGECSKYIFLAPAHRHKRDWYKGDVEKLSDYKQWVCGCTMCHQRIEYDKELTEKVFEKLRGKE